MRTDVVIVGAGHADLAEPPARLRGRLGRGPARLSHDAGDHRAAGQGIDAPAPERFEPARIPASPPLSLDLRQIRTVLWATGYRPDFSWLDVPVLDRKGRIRHTGGVADAPGLYLMGMPFLRRRKSALIDGAGEDAGELAAHLAGHLGAQRAAIDLPIRSMMSGGTRLRSSVLSASTSST